MVNKPRIVLDTNVFMISILPRHKYWWIFESIIEDRYTLLVSNEILTEYLEKCSEKYGDTLSNEKLDFLLEFPNVINVNPYYKWNLLQQDPDDNKFVDCAVSGRADYLVSHDKHFNVLKDVPFPEVNVIRIGQFKTLIYD